MLDPGFGWLNSNSYILCIYMYVGGGVTNSELGTTGIPAYLGLLIFHRLEPLSKSRSPGVHVSGYVF